MFLDIETSSSSELAAGVAQAEPAADAVPMSQSGWRCAAELDAQQPASLSSTAVPRAEVLPVASATWSYRDCAQARAAGAAPLYAGQPG